MGDEPAAPVFGWRFWAFEHARGRLYAPYALEANLVQELNPAGEIAAICERNHTPPAPGCYCGIHAFTDWSFLFRLEAPPRSTLERKRWRWRFDGAVRGLRCAVTFGVVDGPIRPDRTGVGPLVKGSFRGLRYTALALVIPQDLQQVELRPNVPLYYGVTPAMCRSVEADVRGRTESYARQP
jgi:hypothetical protein